MSHQERPIASRLPTIPGLQTLARAASLVWNSAPRLTIANVLLMSIQGFLPILPIYFLKLLIDVAADRSSGVDQSKVLSTVLFLIGLIGVTMLLSSAFRAIGGLLAEEQSDAVRQRMYELIQVKSATVDLAFYESSAYFDTLHRAQREAPFRPTKVVTGITQFFINGVSLGALAGLLSWVHWGIVAALLLAVIPGLVLRQRMARLRFRSEGETTEEERRAAMFHWILTGNSFAKEVRLFDLGPLFRARFRDLHRHLRHKRWKMALQRSFADLLAPAWGTMVVFGICAFVAWQTILGSRTLGDLVMFYQALQRMQAAMEGFLTGTVGLYEDHLFLANLFAFLDLPSQVSEPVLDKELSHPFRKGIEFHHVDFRYDEGPRKVLDDVSLTIESGKVIAFVGENGSGKTTLVKLLCRFYDPTSGTITLDGEDYREFRTERLRRSIAVIFQDFARYDLTARENVWVGNAALPPDDERIYEAARRSGADRVLSSLPRGYETQLGRSFEGGVELSVGQWQRVALARAFLRDAPILVLDEPTSSLDAQTEYEVFREFRKLVAGRTAILISHRFGTVRMADIIHVLKAGRIIETGTHEELLALNGSYACAFRLQADQFR